MADKRPAHRRGTTGKAWRKFRSAVVDSSSVCGRCGQGGFVTTAPCDHPTHARLKGCPTHPRYPTLGHIKDLQYGGQARARSNARVEHFRCNVQAGANSQVKREPRVSWDW